MPWATRAAERVIRSLDRIIEWRGKPGTIRVDSGPEYVSENLKKWAEKHGVTIQNIQPGQPQQNAYVERYSRTVRHEWPPQYIIESIEEAQYQATQWLWTYNNDRPNMGIAALEPVFIPQPLKNTLGCMPLLAVPGEVLLQPLVNEARKCIQAMGYGQ